MRRFRHVRQPVLVLLRDSLVLSAVSAAVVSPLCSALSGELPEASLGGMLFVSRDGSMLSISSTQHGRQLRRRQRRDVPGPFVVRIGRLQMLARGGIVLLVVVLAEVVEGVMLIDLDDYLLSNKIMETTIAIRKVRNTIVQRSKQSVSSLLSKRTGTGRSSTLVKAVA